MFSNLFSFRRKVSIILTHSLGNGKTFRERITTKEFFQRTFCIFKVDHLVEFIHFETTGEVVIIDRRD